MHTFTREQAQPGRREDFSFSRAAINASGTHDRLHPVPHRPPASASPSASPFDGRSAPRPGWDFSRVPVNARATRSPAPTMSPGAAPSRPPSDRRLKLSAKEPGQSKTIQDQWIEVAQAEVEGDEGPETAPAAGGGPAPAGGGGQPADECPPGTPWVPGKVVVPVFVLHKPAPKRSSTRPSTTDAKDPTFAGEVAVDCNAKAWRYQLNSVESKGTIQIVYYRPRHYPAPTPNDDSGPLTNVKKNNWEDIVKDLDENKAGIFDFWAAYQAEDVHEDYHWTTEWQRELTKELPNAQRDIDNLKVDFTKAATPAAAEKKLLPRAKRAFNRAMRRARRAYAKLGDKPGDPPYQAQVPVVESLIQRVKDYAQSNGWS